MAFWDYVPLVGDIRRAKKAGKEAKNIKRGLKEAESFYQGLDMPPAASVSSQSAMRGAAADPFASAAQAQAIRRYMDIQNQGGLTGSDRARLALVNQQNRMAARAQQDAILNDYRQRGLATQGSALSARLQSAQNAANQQALQGQQVAGMAQDRMDQALAAQGALAGQARGQSFDEASRRAAAADLMNQFAAQFNAAQQADAFARALALRDKQYGARTAALTGGFDAWKQGAGYQAAANQTILDLLKEGTKTIAGGGKK